MDVKKIFTFSGNRILDGDRLKFVRFDSLTCEGIEPMGDIMGPLVNVSSQELIVKGPSGVGQNELTFMERSDAGGRSFIYCYAHGQEPYKLYTSFRITSKQVYEVVPSAGSPTVAVVGALKTFSYIGTGNALGDIVKFVPYSSSSDLDCNLDSPYVTSDGVSGGTVPDVSFSLSAGIDGKYESSANIPILFLRFSEIASWKLCYKFGSEPFKMYSEFAVDAKEVSYMDAFPGSPDTAVVDSTIDKYWSVYAYGILDGDRLKWVPNDIVNDAGCGPGRQWSAF